MNILLISLSDYEVNKGLVYFPLGLFYIKGYGMKYNPLLKDVSIKVKILDSNLSSKEILAAITSENCKIVGFSCWCWNINKILEVSHLLKSFDKSVKIILGGPQVSPMHEGQDLLKFNKTIDVIVHGEGEVTFSELVKSYLLDKPSLHEIAGISFREGEQIISTSYREPLANLDDISYIISTEEMRAFDLSKTIFLLETHRGCPFKCRFCYYNKGFKGVRYFSLQIVKKNIKFLLDNGIHRLYLADPTFNINLNRAKDILKFIIEQKKNLILNAEIKAELIDEEFVKLLYKAGIKFLDVGLQSINPHALEAMNRNLDKAKFEKGVELLIKEKIGFQIQLIKGLPGDNYEGFCESINYAMKLINNNWWSMEVFPLQIIPGSEFYDKFSEWGIIFEKSPPNYVLQTKTFSRNDMEKIENMLISLKQIYSSSIITTLANSLQQQPTEIAIDWSSWFTKNAGLHLEQFNDMSLFTRVRLFKKFLINKYHKADTGKFIHSSRYNLLIARAFYTILKCRIKLFLNN